MHLMNPRREGPLTGRVRHRVGFSGRMVLLVEYAVEEAQWAPPPLVYKDTGIRRWRDATYDDLSILMCWEAPR